MKKIVLLIDGMTCSACSNGLEKYLNKQEGIINASVNLVLSQALIEYNDNITIDDLNKFISDAGYKSLGKYDEVNMQKKKNKKEALILFTILSILVLYISMSDMFKLPMINLLNMQTHPINYSLCLLILTIPYLIYGRDIFRNGIKNLMHKNPNMDTLVSLGVLASFIYSLYQVIMIIFGNFEYTENLYFESSCIVIFFIKLGRYIDSNSKEKTKDAIKNLVTITPTKAILKLENKEKEVTIDEVKKNDILICKPGMKVAVDGIITKGSSHFDESFLTGESIPSKKNINDKVVAGSLNIDGYIEYKAVNIGKDSIISEIVRLVVEATNTKAPISVIADKVCNIFVPSVIIISFLTLIIYLMLGANINTSITHFVTVLVVSCPCALGLATPLAMVVSIGTCAKNGILVKTNETLENAHKIDTVIFDKTGTLTFGKLNIDKVYNYSNLINTNLLQIVSSIESLSIHPISNAFIKKAKEEKIKLKDVSDFKDLPGLGISGKIDEKTYYIGNSKLIDKLKIKNIYKNQEEELENNGNSIVYVANNNEILGLIGVKDIVRNNAKKVVNELEKQNIKVIMLTGDNEKTAKIIANEVGIKQIISNVLPKEKVNFIKELVNNKKKVMMVGDGINDAPSLATATIGVSISSATDIANNSSDVILMNDNLESILKLIKISKKTVINIKENLFWAFFYNICMIPIAIGIFTRWNINMNPMIGSMAMMISSLTVVFNALRLKKINLGGDK